MIGPVETPEMPFEKLDAPGTFQPNHSGLWRGFMRSAEKFPERPAVIVEGRILCYWQLREKALRIAATLQDYYQHLPTPLIAVFAHRSAVAFAGVLGSLLAGNGYVPLNCTFPVARTRLMFERSQCGAVIVDSESLPQLNALLDGHEGQLLVIGPDLQELQSHREQWPQHIFIYARDLKSPTAWREPTVDQDAIAYLLFTSGSTGVPKGVMVAHRNVTSFVEHTADRYELTERDIASQMFDLTFDLSAFDMFVSWERGACLCCPSRKTLINPGQFIHEQKLTIWFSVPSMVALMKQLGLLKPDRFPSLRLSLFCGEPLPISSAEAWLKAAPNTILENLYGPTELTIACTSYRWQADQSPGESELGIVPIGYPYPGMDLLVVDDSLNEVKPGEEGELLMNGPQMSLGYWRDPERTNSAFIVPPSRKEIFYRTGDRVRRPVGDRPLTHLGRIDFQVKILGHRVELGEVEAVVREASGMDGVVAIGWPASVSGYGGIEVFIEGESVNVDWLRDIIASRLPNYMVPRRYHLMNRLPRNANDKFDRGAMIAMLGGGM
jgi:amino acid adenylation domain-containing protein